MKKEDLILDILKETREDVRDIKQKTEEIEKLDAIQNEQLREHMRRTEASEKRIDRLEDRELKSKLYSGGLVALIVAIAEILRRTI